MATGFMAAVAFVATGFMDHGGRTETLIVAGLIVLSKQYQVSHYQRLCNDRTENAICH